MTGPRRLVARPDPPWLADALACQRCHGTISEVDNVWWCAMCGVAGSRTLGFPDFLVGAARLPLANNDSMELLADDTAGTKLAKRSCPTFTSSIATAEGLQAEAAGRAGWSARRQQACHRFHSNLVHLNAEASALGGQSLLNKVDSKLAELNWQPIGVDGVLEAGGGAGYFLPAFSQRFRRVVFADASLSNLILAFSLCKEQGLTNVAFIRADITALPLMSSQFDMVHENGVIEHVDQPRRMLTEAARVRSDHGYLVCVSPNRFSIAPEPHFGLPLYGLIPARLRQTIVPVLRGFKDGSGTDLLSLRELRRGVATVLDGDEITLFFLPRQLLFTARQTSIRHWIRTALSLPHIGDWLNTLLNVKLLSIMPQHIVIARRPITVGGPSVPGTNFGLNELPWV